MTPGKLFGVSGLTLGALGIWTGVIGSLIVYTGRVAMKWIAGMADRRRAETESIPVESKATSDLILTLTAQIARMDERMKLLEKRVDELEDEKRVIIAERDTALADNARLRAVNYGQGQARQEAAIYVAVERAQDQLGKTA